MKSITKTSKSALDILASTAINDRCNQLTKEIKQITHENQGNKKILIDRTKHYNKIVTKLEDVTKQKEEYKKLWQSSTSTTIIANTVSKEKDHDKMNDLQRQFKNQIKYIKQKYNAEIR